MQKAIRAGIAGYRCVHGEIENETEAAGRDQLSCHGADYIRKLFIKENRERYKNHVSDRKKGNELYSGAGVLKDEISGRTVPGICDVSAWDPVDYDRSRKDLGALFLL